MPELALVPPGAHVPHVVSADAVASPSSPSIVVVMVVVLLVVVVAEAAHPHATVLAAALHAVGPAAVVGPLNHGGGVRS